jgi:ubiquinone/menaquinone biosynthesis C-methylase UbiE
MAKFDIDQQEIEHIKKVVDLSGKRVLEIGCGEGRLTKQLGPLCASVMAIDPETDAIQLAIAANKFTNVTFQTADVLDLPFDDQSFDVIIFSLSLCCVEPESNMRSAILQAIRVLRKGGYLLNFMPSTIRNFDAGWMWYYINPEDQSQLLDISVAAARLALKQVTFIDRLLTFVEERRVLTRWGLRRHR